MCGSVTEPKDAPQKLSVWGRTFKHNLSQAKIGLDCNRSKNRGCNRVSERAVPGLVWQESDPYPLGCASILPWWDQAGRPAVVVQRSARLHQRQFYLSRFAFQVVPFGFVCGALLLLSRFGLAIPALILDNCGVGQAITSHWPKPWRAKSLLRCIGSEIIFLVCRKAESAQTASRNAL